MKRVLFIAVIVLALALAVALRYSGVLVGEKNRLLENQAALLQTQHEYKLRDSLNAVSVGVLTMKADELRRGFGEMEALVRDMNVKLRRVENISQTALEGRYDVSAVLRDTVAAARMASPSTEGDTLTGAVEDILLRPAQVLRFRDAHMELNGIIIDSLFRGSVVTYDTLTQIVHRIPRRFLFIRWGTKELRQEIVSSNPHTHITYNRTIRIRK